MTIIGRLTKNASITTLKDERKVVSFSIAINCWFKSKNNPQGVKVTTYVNCSYWISTGIATRLTKGSLVELSGRLEAKAYTGVDGEVKASLNCHVNNITIHHTAKESKEDASHKAPSIPEVKDDLPF